MREIYVTGRGMLTPAGFDFRENLAALARGETAVRFDAELGAPVGRLCSEAEAKLWALREEKAHKRSDRAVLLGVLAAREAFAEARSAYGIGGLQGSVSVIMGSSRGATGLLEKEHKSYLETGKLAINTSPATTAGAFAAAVAQDLGASGMSMSASSACSTGLNALGTGYALLCAGLADHAIVGGAEASLTPFTLTQLRTVGVLCRAKADVAMPSRPYHAARSGMAPGEGAACLVLSHARPTHGPVVRIAGFGAATEAATPTGISDDGHALLRAIRQALGRANLGPGDVDLIVGHGASTLKGDAAELACYSEVFGEAMPPLTSHKWLTGHMIGAAGAHSAALSTAHLLQNEKPLMPYDLQSARAVVRRDLRSILVTALGFGGSAAATILVRA